MKEWHIILLGFVLKISYLAFLFSLINLLAKKNGIIISEEFLIDNSKYEAIGKIKWVEISKIQRIKKSSIQIFLKNNPMGKVNGNLLKKFLLMMHNWDYKNSIIISSALLKCDIDYLEKQIVKAYKNSQLKETNTLEDDFLSTSIDDIKK